jgi:lipopolysaccharide/colanic/teichoic acid biosynthesis glycosyltransferase
MQVPLPSSRNRNKVYVSTWDVFCALVSPILALVVRDGAAVFSSDWTVIGYYWLFASGLALMSFFALRIQDGMVRNFSVQEALYILEAVLFTELMTMAVLFSLTRLDGIPRSMPIIHGALLGAGLIAGRMLFRIILPDQHVQGHQNRQERIIVIGANRFATFFVQMLNAYAPPAQPVIGVLSTNRSMVGRTVAGAPVLGEAHEIDAVVTEFAVHGVNTDRVIIADEAETLSEAVRTELERVCTQRQIKLQYLPRLIGMTEWTVASQPLQSTEIAIASPKRSYFHVKRAIDIVGSLFLMVLFLPIGVFAAVLVLLDVGPPVLFWQERVGWGGRAFLIYKFRTLRAPFDAEGNHTLLDRQPSFIGRFLRASRIDELPQLLNVLLGDMSLIGPRPLLPEDQPSNAASRLSVRPGITGWAQVNGGKLITKEDKEKFDQWYIDNASLLIDLRIVFMTLMMMMTNRMSGHEAAADRAQVQDKAVNIASASTMVEKAPAQSR